MVSRSWLLLLLSSPILAPRKCTNSTREKEKEMGKKEREEEREKKEKEKRRGIQEMKRGLWEMDSSCAASCCIHCSLTAIPPEIVLFLLRFGDSFGSGSMLGPALLI